MMDSRIAKTIRSIHNAFYALCKSKPLSQISVKEIVTEAEINKTTFYHYYENVEHLIDDLETQEINKILDSFQNYSLYFRSPGKFFNQIVDSFVSSERIRVFIDKNRTSIISSKICNGIFNKICDCEPIIKESENAKYILKFFLYGILNSYLICFRNSAGDIKIEDCYRLNQILEIPLLAMMKYGQI